MTETDVAATDPEPFAELDRHVIGDIVVRWLTDPDGHVGLRLHPAGLDDRLAVRRRTLAGEVWVRDPEHPPAALALDPLAHVALAGEPSHQGYGLGRTLRWSPANDGFHQTGHERTGETTLTTLDSPAGLRLEHRLTPGPDDLTLAVDTRLTNTGDAPVTVTLLTAFSLGGITPFAVDDAPGRLVAHRFRSAWSSEGRLVSDPIEHLHLERSFAGGTLMSERFGQIGSMPTRGWFPTVVVTDTEADVSWGARLAVNASWQLELARKDDSFGISGGLADAEFGHWQHTLAPGETLQAPPAWLTCVAGGVDAACARLVTVDRPAVDAKPAVEQDLPIIFNEWCTTWGTPKHDRMLAIADRIAPLGVRYLVIDAGWFRPVAAPGEEAPSWASSIGDWVPSTDLFPDGIGATASAIRERGVIPGVWFEAENVARDAAAYHDTEHLLQRDGHVITSGPRRFWDLSDPYVVDYLDAHVIGLLRDAGFGYVKIDYNATIGVGCDHPDGPGAGLAQWSAASHAWFERLAAALPELVIENCASGGHRLEASMLQRTSMSSFSDAHETEEIPIIAAALHRLMLPRQSQIWAVLRRPDSPRRLVYSLAATFLGRMCLSGDITDLDDDQWEIVRTACDLYRAAAPIIRDGASMINDANVGPAWRHATGWQSVVQATDDAVMAVVHGFAGAPEQVEVGLPEGEWQITSTLAEADTTADLTDGSLRVSLPGDFSAQVVLLARP